MPYILNHACREQDCKSPNAFDQRPFARTESQCLAGSSQFVDELSG